MVTELHDQSWIATSSSQGEAMLGAWPGLAEPPRIVHTSRDWLTKLWLVACGAGMTTIPSLLRPVLPANVRALRVVGGSRERRRAIAAHLPSAASPAVEAVVTALHEAAVQLLSEG